MKNAKNFGLNEPLAKSNDIRKSARNNTLKKLNIKMAFESIKELEQNTQEKNVKFDPKDFNKTKKEKRPFYHLPNYSQKILPILKQENLTIEVSKTKKEKRGNRTKSVETSAKNGSKKNASSKNLISTFNQNHNKGKSNNSLPFIPFNNNYEFSTKTFQAGNDKKNIINIPQGQVKNILHAASGPLNKIKNSTPTTTEPTNKTRNIIHEPLHKNSISSTTEPTNKTRNIIHIISGPLNKNSISNATEPTNKTRNIIHAASGPVFKKTFQGDKEEFGTQKKGEKIPEENISEVEKKLKRKANFRNYERRISKKEYTYVPVENDKNRVGKFEKPEEEKKTRRRSIGVGLRRKVTKEYQEFNTTLYTKFSEATSVAGRDDDGLKKINQDTYLLEKNINGVINFNVFGVLDGHGVNGHYASNFVKRYLISRIKNHPLIKNLQTPKEIYKQLTSNGYQIIAKLFLDADVQIAKEKFNVEMSGTTVALVIQLGEHLICANAGDSRAILVYDDSNSNNLLDTKIYLLSYDCKPDLPYERKRIEANGGVVAQIIDEDDLQPWGPFRVWVKGEEYPGIAISRSIGDLDAKKVGVIPNPQIIEYTLNSKSKYMIICSDGIWEYLKNEEVMKVANEFYLKSDPLGLCRKLTNQSTELWLKDDVVVDDITCVAVFF